MTTAKAKKPKRGRPENPKYQETICIDAPPRVVAKAIMKKPPKKEWRFLRGKNKEGVNNEDDCHDTGNGPYARWV